MCMMKVGGECLPEGNEHHDREGNNNRGLHPKVGIPSKGVTFRFGVTAAEGKVVNVFGARYLPKADARHDENETRHDE